MVQIEILQKARDYLQENRKVMFTAENIGFEDIDLTDALNEGFLERVDLGVKVMYVFTPTAWPQVQFGDLFSDIYGYEDVKEIFYRVLQSKSNNGILMIGPPASAKTMFLQDISKLPNSSYVLMTHVTKKGLNEILIDDQPDYLILEELDKAKREDYSTLHGLMEYGQVQRHIHGRHDSLQLKTKVFAAANYNRFAPSILSRFQVLNFRTYARQELHDIGVHILSSNGRNPECAKMIADKIMDIVSDPRDFMKFSDMLVECTPTEVQHVKDLLKRHR